MDDPLQRIRQNRVWKVMGQTGADVAEQPKTSSFEDFVAARQLALQRFAYLVTLDREDARDAVQEALAGLYRHWNRVSAQGDPESYVRRSIVNAHVSQWRRRGSERVARDPHVFEAAAPGDLSQSVADADTVARLFTRLDRRSRAVVSMRFWEGRSFAEIAEACGCAEATARSLLHRAVMLMRTELLEER